MENQTRSLVITQRSIQLDGRTIAYTLRRNRRAKRVTLKVDTSGLTMTVPWSFPHDQLDLFIRQRQDWLLANLARFAQTAVNAVEGWSPADGVFFLGQQRVIRFDPHGEDPYLQGKTIVLPEGVAGDHTAVRSILERWLKESARLYLIERLGRLATTMGVSPQRVTLRNQKTRWGSCSSQGGISLNWRLIMAPPAVIDYVLIHELAHLSQMNHSDRFWQIVARYDPHYRDHRQWLRVNGVRLMGSGV